MVLKGKQRATEELAKGRSRDVPSTGGQSAQPAQRVPGASVLLLEWRVWLAGRHPWKAMGAVAAIALGAFLVALALTSVALGLLALLLLVAGTWEFFVPIRYQISEEGALAEGPLLSHFVRWEKVRRCYLSREGMKLSPLRGGSRLEPFRGVHLRFGDNRGEVVEMVKRLAKEREVE